MATDASATGIGAVIYQKDGEETKYIEFAAKSLSPAARNYSATKRKLLAVVFALTTFNFYLWGRHFTLFTDHQAISYLFTQKHTNAMINRWIDIILPFNFTIIHQPGMRNVLPDKLSRLYPTFCWNSTKSSGAILAIQTKWDSEDYKLNPIFFKYLDRRYGPHTVDLFATEKNTFLPRFYMKENSAFYYSWHAENAWATPHGR